MLPSTPRTFVGSTTFTVAGIRCRRCRWEVVDAIAAVPGVSAVSFHRDSDTVTVSASAAVDRADVVHAIARCGYGSAD